MYSNSLWQDIRLTARRLLRARGFSLAVVLTLALGIGANSALFSVVNAVLLRPLPFEEPSELVVIWETRPAQDAFDVTVSLGNFEDWRRSSTVFQQMAVVQRRPYNVTGSGEPIRINAIQATADLLPLLGVHPVLGRGFSAREERPGSEPVCVVSNGLWLSRFGGAPDLNGVHLNLDGRSHAVVGVLPASFELPGTGISDMGALQVVTPLIFDPRDPNYRGNHNSVVVARLRDGVSVEQADAEIASLAGRLETQYPEWNEGVGARVRSLHEQVVQGVRSSILLLFAAAAFVLLLACVNIATLLLVRASAREREMAVRAALGAERTRLVQHVLIEALMLSVVGGVFGLLLCFFAIDALRALAAAWLPSIFDLAVDGRVLGFSFAISILTGLAFGTVPAWMLSGTRANYVLSSGKRLLGQLGRTGMKRAFVATQVAAALVLLIGTGLLLRSFARLTDVEPGYESGDRTAMFVSLPGARYGERSQVTAFLEQLVTEVGALPGVSSAGASIALPLEPLFWQKYMTREEAPAQRIADVPVVDLSIVTAGFSQTMGIPLIKGRRFQSSDRAGSRYVALVNETFVRTQHGDADPIGRRIRLGPPDHLLTEGSVAPPWYTIVGVLGDVRRRGPATAIMPEVYIPQAQDMDVAREFFMVVHTGGHGSDVVGALRRAVQRIDPNQPVARIVELDRMQAASVSQPRTNLLLVGGFGLTALVLAIMGVYGLVSQSVATRTREFGLRLALGAAPWVIHREVTRQGLTVAVFGVIGGLGASLVLTRLMRSLLFGVGPMDPLVFTVAALALIGAVLVTAYLPARRASRADPAEVLKWE
jgi:putative ABC transport system permease protein